MSRLEQIFHMRESWRALEWRQRTRTRTRMRGEVEQRTEKGVVEFGEKAARVEILAMEFVGLDGEPKKKKKGQNERERGRRGDGGGGGGDIRPPWTLYAATCSMRIPAICR
ncbi:hypothetical protein CERZMDRAFT_86896 [Cercospora zeae-maydis SCOH1-5]|uniref:Uncharacterized protein n=1 Tax=Cercospora zeae-maydis SCOH1-5 TaxID=717836 RepID=A0A6A6F8P8_9PEZI|nr:hypothetical protein CERZMDRAFT_86896 [Cercospora zeae-maydis SCOH1-5]